MFLVDHLCQHEACLELNAARPPLPGPTPAHSAPASVIGSLLSLDSGNKNAIQIRLDITLNESDRAHVYFNITSE